MAQTCKCLARLTANSHIMFINDVVAPAKRSRSRLNDIRHVAFRTIREHFVIFRGRGQEAYPRESTLTGRRVRRPRSVGRAIVAKLALKGRWDGWTTRGERKRRKKRTGKRKWARAPVSSRSYDVDDPRGADGLSSSSSSFLLLPPPLSLVSIRLLRLARELESLRALESRYVIRSLDQSIWNAIAAGCSNSPAYLATSPAVSFRID